MIISVDAQTLHGRRWTDVDIGSEQQFNHTRNIGLLGKRVDDDGDSNCCGKISWLQSMQP